MKRAQNCHATVNAGFLMKLQRNSTIVQTATMCFGGINPQFVHATNTETYLIGKDLFTTEVIQGALQVLENELKPDSVLPEPSAQYRKEVAMALLYKFILSSCPAGIVSPINLSGAHELYRDISTGSQSFRTNEQEFPITQPLPKIEALCQTTGEAKFVNDMPYLDGQLWAAFVPATKVNLKIAQIDASPALALEGVRYFYGAKDIPGKNSFTPRLLLAPVSEQIFAAIDDEVLYNGQPVGVICANTMSLATKAAKLVKIMYENSKYSRLKYCK